VLLHVTGKTCEGEAGGLGAGNVKVVDLITSVRDEAKVRAVQRWLAIAGKKGHDWATTLKRRNGRRSRAVDEKC